MLQRVPSQNMFVAEGNGHVGRFHFSYGDYNDPLNGPLGVLEALNDFLIQPSQGFDTHPHKEVEIISYCVEGELSHSDSMQNTGILRRGDVAYQCAGSGISHAERNRSPNRQLRFVQILIKPNTPSLAPRYCSHHFSRHDRRNRWLRVVSNTPLDSAIQISQDANIFVSEADEGTRLAFTVSPRRQVYLVCLEGSLAVGGFELGQGDAVKVIEEDKLSLQALEFAHLLLVEIAASA